MEKDFMVKNNNCREHVLPESANKYILDQLDNSGLLGKLLREEKNVQKAKKVTYLREGISDNALEDYEWGNPPNGYGHTLEWLVAKSKDFLVLGKKRIILLQHRLAKPSDPWFEKTGTRITSFKEEVYLDIYAEEVKQADYIRQRIREADAHFFIGVMSSLPEGIELLPKKLDEATLLNLVKQTEHLIVGAYDGCGYILCSFDK
jgi:hypothetical protein